MKCITQNNDVFTQQATIVQYTLLCNNGLSKIDKSPIVFKYEKDGENKTFSRDSFFKDEEIAGCEFKCNVGDSCGLTTKISGSYIFFNKTSEILSS